MVALHARIPIIWGVFWVNIRRQTWPRVFGNRVQEVWHSTRHADRSIDVDLRVGLLLLDDGFEHGWDEVATPGVRARKATGRWGAAPGVLPRCPRVTLERTSTAWVTNTCRAGKDKTATISVMQLAFTCEPHNWLTLQFSHISQPNFVVHWLKKSCII